MSLNTAAGTNFYIGGGDSTVPSQYWATGAYIQDVHVYAAALSGAQITQDMSLPEPVTWMLGLPPSCFSSANVVCAAIEEARAWRRSLHIFANSDEVQVAQ